MRPNETTRRQPSPFCATAAGLFLGAHPSPKEQRVRLQDTTVLVKMIRDSVETAWRQNGDKIETNSTGHNGPWTRRPWLSNGYTLNANGDQMVARQHGDRMETNSTGRNGPWTRRPLLSDTHEQKNHADGDTCDHKMTPRTLVKRFV